MMLSVGPIATANFNIDMENNQGVYINPHVPKNEMNRALGHLYAHIG